MNERKKDLVSIIIVTFNELCATKRCLKSIRECTSGDYELVIVDNASTDGTCEYLKSFGFCKVIFNSENVGFASGINQGARISEGKYLMLLNNDTVVTSGWFEKMVACLELNSAFALVGPMTNDPDTGAQFYRPALFSYVDYDYFKAVYGHLFQGRYAHQLLQIGAYRNERELMQFAWKFFPVAGVPSYRKTNCLAGFCVLIRRSWVDELGFLDERFKNGGEDNDLNIRTLLAGKKIVVAENAFVHHDAGRSFFGAGVDRWPHFAKNRKLLEEKWEKVPRAQRILEEYASMVWKGWLR